MTDTLATTVIAPNSHAEDVLAAMPVGVAAFAADRRLRFANPRFAVLFRLPPDRLLPDADFAAILDLLAQRMSSPLRTARHSSPNSAYPIARGRRLRGGTAARPG